jgi:hypothetical protein
MRIDDQQGDAGSVVRVAWNVLEADEQAPTPRRTEDPVQATVRGVVDAPVHVGEVVEVRTASGRSVRGRVIEVDPRYPASFGTPIHALTRIGPDLKSRCWSTS